MRKKEKLTFWGIIIEGIKKFAGEIIGTFLLAVFLLCFPSFRALLFEYRLPIEHETIHHQEDEPKTAEAQKAETKQAEVPKAKPETPKPVAKPKRPAMTDKEFVELCKTGWAKRVEEAIMNGANINARDNGGYTALMWAAIKGRTEIAGLLLKHGVDVNAKDSYGGTALTKAANDGYAEIAELLLKHGADVNAKNDHGKTALMKATKNNHTKTADLLRAYGAK